MRFVVGVALLVFALLILLAPSVAEGVEELWTPQTVGQPVEVEVP